MTQDAGDVSGTQIRESRIMTIIPDRFKLVRNLTVAEHLEWYMIRAFFAPLKTLTYCPEEQENLLRCKCLRGVDCGRRIAQGPSDSDFAVHHTGRWMSSLHTPWTDWWLCKNVKGSDVLSTFDEMPKCLALVQLDTESLPFHKSHTANRVLLHHSNHQCRNLTHRCVSVSC